MELGTIKTRSTTIFNPDCGTSVHQIGTRKIHVHDGVFPAELYAKFLQQAENLPFKRRERASRANPAGVCHWSTDFDIEFFQHEEFYQYIYAQLTNDFPGRTYHLTRCYINLSTFGDWLPVHRDCSETSHDVTALVYLCREWKIDWGGETVFVDQSDDIAASIAMKPGRLVTFSGQIPHAGRPPSRDSYHSRMTLALKFSRATSENE
jgi:SM-20-related protein